MRIFHESVFRRVYGERGGSARLSVEHLEDDHLVAVLHMHSSCGSTLLGELLGEHRGDMTDTLE